MTGPRHRYWLVLAVAAFVRGGAPAAEPVPSVSVRVGPDAAKPSDRIVHVRVGPWFELTVRPNRRVEVASKPRPAPEPAPATLLSDTDSPIALDAFCRTFHPARGFYEIVFIHPDTGGPVVAHFSLPDGTPRLRKFRRQVAFDYGDSEVRIRFVPRGDVRVEYR